MDPVRSLRPAAVPEDLELFFASPGEGPFVNPWRPALSPRPTDLLRWTFGPRPYAAARRSRPYLPELEPDPVRAWDRAEAGWRVQWLGHASVLAQIDGCTFVVDPVFGRAGVVPRQAPTPRAAAEFPPLDAVLITHGHYDHLDVASVRALCCRFPDVLVVVPRGLEGSLPREAKNRRVLSWWDALEVQGVEIVLVPAQHWHRRGPLDLNRALWGGYVVRGRRSLYHSGDTGYAGHFRAIGHRFPGIDVACLPAGAWEPRWFMGPQHQDPGESVRAFLDLGAHTLLAMHWGTFDLTDEPLWLGPERLREAAAAVGVEGRVQVLRHGGVL
jgi:L-ascorbate metabolism protein UlaG (beta-lactamase superfamily)